MVQCPAEGFQKLSTTLPWREDSVHGHPCQVLFTPRAEILPRRGRFCSPVLQSMSHILTHHPEPVVLSHLLFGKILYESEDSKACRKKVEIFRRPGKSLQVPQPHGALDCAQGRPGDSGGLCCDRAVCPTI